MRHARPILALAAFVSLPLLADEAPTPTSTPVPNAAAKKAAGKTGKPPAAKAGASGAANMIVTKDPETGELRPATAAEIEKLLGPKPLVAREHLVVTLPDGSKMVELGEADMSYAVTTKNADGTFSQGCVHGAEAAAKAVASRPSSAAPAPAQAKTDR
jgi:hypothetical protein